MTHLRVNLGAPATAGLEVQSLSRGKKELQMELERSQAIFLSPEGPRNVNVATENHYFE